MYDFIHLSLVGGITLLDPAVPLGTTSELLADADWEAAAMVAVLSLAIGGAVIWEGFDHYQTSRLVKNTATERVRSMAVGRTELNGAARPYEGTFPRPFTEGECIYGKYRVKERVKKEDDDGEMKTVWESIAVGSFAERMVLEDETGAVILENPPMGYSGKMCTTKTQGKLANLFEDTFLGDWLNLGPDAQTARFLEEHDIPLTSGNRRQYEQKVVPDGTELYVLGQATRRSDDTDEAILDQLHERHETFADELIIERDSGSGEYIVTSQDEDEVSRTQLMKAMGTIATGILCVAFGAGMLGVALQNYGVL